MLLAGCWLLPTVELAKNMFLLCVPPPVIVLFEPGLGLLFPTSKTKTKLSINICVCMVYAKLASVLCIFLSGFLGFHEFNISCTTLAAFHLFIFFFIYFAVFAF